MIVIKCVSRFIKIVCGRRRAQPRRRTLYSGLDMNVQLNEKYPQLFKKKKKENKSQLSARNYGDAVWTEEFENN